MSVPAETTTPPLPWQHVADVSIGGLYAIGFVPGTEDVLVISQQGRGVYRATSAERVARDRDNTWGWYDRQMKQAVAIGPYAGQSIAVVGVDGGQMATTTVDGWLLSKSAAGRLCLSSPAGTRADFSPRWRGELLRAFGFSESGRCLAVAVGAHTLELYARLGNDEPGPDS